MILCIGTTPAVQRVMLFSRVVTGAVNRSTSTLEGASGKSVNVAKVVHQLGGRAVCTGFLGGDRGEFLGSALSRRGVEIEFVPVKARTRECITVVDESSGSQTELVEESGPVSPDEYQQLLAVIRRHVLRCGAAVMSGTLCPGVPVDFYEQCTRLVRNNGGLAVLDVKGPPLMHALKVQPDVVKPNREELAATFGRELDDLAILQEAILNLQRQGARNVVVTAGSRPAIGFDGNTFWQIASPEVRAVNPIGSGDAFTAALTLRLLKGDSLDEACRWGAAAGAANALTPMVGEVDLEQVQKLLPRVTVSIL